MGTEKSYEVGRGRPPKASRWKKGQTGNRRGKARKPASEAELIEREFRRSSSVTVDGEQVRRTAFEVIFQQLLRREAEGDRRAGQTRDRYHRFALANQVSGGVILRFAQNDFTRKFSAELRRDRNNPQNQGPASDSTADLASAEVAAPSSDEPTKSKL